MLVFKKLEFRCVLLPLLLTLAASNARGDFVVTMTESGGDVVVSGSGIVDLVSLLFLSVPSAQARVEPDRLFIVGPTVSTPADFYAGTVTGPSNFGFGTTSTFASTGSGDLLGLVISPATPGQIIVPNNYISGAAISGSSTYAGQSLNSLGITPGTYVWTIGANTVTLNATIPEPSGLVCLGIVGTLLCYRRRKRR